MTVNMNSVRLRILQQMKTVFAGIDATTVPSVDDPYGIVFSTVQIGPLGDWDQRKRYSMGIAVGAERETFQIPYVMCFMIVNLELRVTVNRDDLTPGEMIEQMITVVKRVVGNNRKWGNIAIDTKVSGSEVDLTTYFDRSAMGVVQTTIQYRYNYDDPRVSGPTIGP